MIKIFIEAEKEETPEANFINTILKQLFSKEKCSEIEVQYVKGKDNLDNFQNIFIENTLSNGINLIIFDADSPENKGGFKKRKAELLAKKEELNIQFELFLLPNNNDDGCFETILEHLTVSEHQHILDCFNSFENCLQSKMDAQGEPKYVLPNIKSRYYTYITSMQLSNTKRKSISYKWQFDDKQYWNIEDFYLEPLKEFIINHCK